MFYMIIIFLLLMILDMGRTKKSQNLTKSTQEAIVEGYRMGNTQAQLAQQFSIARTTVCMLLKRHRVQGGFVVKKKTGRPRITDRVTDRSILRLAREDPRRTAVDIGRELVTPGKSQPSVRTIQKRLQAAGLHGRRPVKKPFVSEKNKKARIAWAKEHLTWTRQQWNSIIWSDESKYLMFGTDGISWVRRPTGTRFSPRYQMPTVKHGGGSVMVWGCFSSLGTGPLVRIEGIMDRHVYKEILEKTMLPWARQKMGRSWTFQQDNDPKHKSKDVTQWFDQQKVRVMNWPSQSPDLNPIEHLWEELGRRLRGTRAASVDEKFKQLKEEWEKIDQSVLNNLLDSMPRRCQAVIDSKGFPTKY